MPIYLDHAATTRVCPAAVEAALHAMTEQYGNPSSGHRLGLEATAAVARQRREVAAALGCLPEELFFTSGGTEGDNWALHIARQAGQRQGKHIITTSVEHAAILEPMRALEKQGYSVSYLEPDKEGRITAAQVMEQLREDTILVSMMLLNNENGVRFPVEETAQLLKQRGSQALFHTDAVQGFLKLPFTVGALGVDLLTVSAHKIGGMKGAGALYVRKGVKAEPLLYGGGQEHGQRSGTEATPQIAAFAAACADGLRDLEAHSAQLKALKDYALQTLPRALPTLVVVSEGDAPHICAISLPGYPSELLLRDLSDRDICVSSGSACHKGKPSHVFAAMKLPHRVLRSVLRLSFGPENTKADIDALCAALVDIAATRVPSKQ